MRGLLYPRVLTLVQRVGTNFTGKVLCCARVGRQVQYLRCPSSNRSKSIVRASLNLRCEQSQPLVL